MNQEKVIEIQTTEGRTAYVRARKVTFFPAPDQRFYLSALDINSIHEAQQKLLEREDRAYSRTMGY